MDTLLYGELTPWYRLLDPPADHHEEVERYLEVFARAGIRGGELLELGAGAGHNALFLKERFACTLSDLSEPMLALSRELNPDQEHVRGDMRSLRLQRAFDAVLVHDAIMYMTSRDDLAAAARTAFEHTRPGGAAIFEPDCVRETFVQGATLEGSDSEDGARGLRAVMWSHDPDPSDEVICVDFAFLLREGASVRAVHERHLEGLFARATWLQVLGEAGFEVEGVPQTSPESAPELFVCRRARD